MSSLARAQTSDCSHPVLDLFTSVNGILTDVATVEFQIYDATSGTPVQVFPFTPGDRVALDVENLCPVGSKLSVGRYVATWTVPSNESLGTHQIKWYFKLTNTSTEQTFVEEFEVLSQVMGASSNEANYVYVSEMRDEGVPSSIPDGLLWQRIAIASRFVEAATRRVFYPVQRTFRVDGTGGAKLLLSDPIISIEYVKFEISPLYPEDFTVVETDIMRVYNRHLSMGLLEPDDRNNPKIELFNPGFVRERHTPLLTRLNFPIGQQNVEVKGWFGYTDPDGMGTQGKTPDLIKHVTKLICIRQLQKMIKLAARSDAANHFRLVSESTRDQAYSLEALGARVGAFFTGDPEIDNILAYYQRPPTMGAV